MDTTDDVMRTYRVTMDDGCAFDAGLFSWDCRAVVFYARDGRWRTNVQVMPDGQTIFAAPDDDAPANATITRI